MLRIVLLTAFVMYFGIVARSQDIRLAEIKFEKNNSELSLAFAGGLRAPQFNTTDLNLDGRDDILIFERDGNVYIPLIRQPDGSLLFDPSYRDILPKVNSWMLLRDYDGDGIQDIFCSPVEIGLPGIEVYKGTVTEGHLSFELVRFPSIDFDILSVPIGNSVTQVYASVIDIPDIRDIDMDGDLDVVAFEPSGSTIYAYYNQAIEQGFTRDTLIYLLEENCYGGMVESGFSQEVSLSPDAGVCASFLWEGDDIIASARHSGSTVLSIDVTGDGLQELILGDISYDGLVMLLNSGTHEQAHFTEQNVRFPEGVDAVDIEIFLSVFYEDFDNDDDFEMIVSPNDRFASQTTNHIWLYQVDHMEGAASEFTLTDRNFLVNDMINPGTNTAPMFFDFNNDGLVDLLVGSSGLSPDGIEVNPRLVLYMNTGSAANPKFELTSDDFLEMSAFKTTSRQFVPALGDLDGDGDKDLVVGDNNGRLYYIENASLDQESFDFLPPVYDPFGIKVSANAVPSIYDFNGDGLGDIILGEQNFNSFEGKRGSLNYFQNIGVLGQPSFNSDVDVSPNDPLFGRVFIKEDGFINNYSAPGLVNLGEELLIATGSAQGFVYLFSTDSQMPKDSFELKAIQYAGIREGAQSIPSFADLDGDQYLEMAIGTRRGGIAIYHTDIMADLETSSIEVVDQDQIMITPNPSGDFISVSFRDGSLINARMNVYDINGRVVLKDVSTNEKHDISALSNGVYIVELRVDHLTHSVRFLKIGKG